MATQSLYRRYRPRRFSEVRGQDHVVKALRTSVAEGREGQAYLFSGPRGTGKTTSARILAKVLNCTDPRDGEPCCECESCLSVERGTSYDVHELDAASNNGVDSMRDLIDKASLGTPGRHKVYILDEVHMLTKPAEAALLKTLEEPPPHVVFVLATTDPQKMSDTIRSRTQHLQFHLLPADTLQAHIRWVADDAGLDVSDEAIEQVLAQGAGSARDALSALELVANSGGAGIETVPLGEFVEAMIERDPSRALMTAARAIGLGRDPRTVTEELVGYLRNGFLSIMAPDLVQLPSDRIAALSDQAQRLGAAGLVRGIEQLGEALTEMRHAPDPRVLLDVAIVKLTADSVAAGDGGAAVGALTARIAKLEQQLAAGTVAPRPASGTGTASSAAEPTSEPATEPGADSPRDAATGRATLGGRARREAPVSSASTPAAAAAATTEGGPASAADAAATSGNSTVGSASAAGAAPSAPAATETPATDTAATVSASDSASDSATDSATDSASDSASDSAATPRSAADGAAVSESLWDDTVKPGLRGMTRAVFSPASYVSNTATVLTLSLPNPVHRDKCEQHRADVEAALRAAAGGPVTLELILAGGGGPGPGDGAGPGAGAGNGAVNGGVGGRSGAPTVDAPTRAPEPPMDPGHPAADPRADQFANSDADGELDGDAVAAPGRPTESPRRAAERKLAEAQANGRTPDLDGDLDGSAQTEAEIHVLPEDHEVDLTDLTDAPPEAVRTPIDRLAAAFPGSELVTETH